MGTDLDNDKNLLMITDPIMHVQAWLDEAVETEVNDANAMSLATVDEDDMPQPLRERGLEFALLLFRRKPRQCRQQEHRHGHPKESLRQLHQPHSVRI